MFQDQICIVIRGTPRRIVVLRHRPTTAEINEADPANEAHQFHRDCPPPVLCALKQVSRFVFPSLYVDAPLCYKVAISTISFFSHVHGSPAEIEREKSVLGAGPSPSRAAMLNAATETSRVHSAHQTVPKTANSIGNHDHPRPSSYSGKQIPEATRWGDIPTRSYVLDRRFLIIRKERSSLSVDQYVKRTGIAAPCGWDRSVVGARAAKVRSIQEERMRLCVETHGLRRSG